jgi:transposase-like protein
MGQVLHPNARTTQAVRRAIRDSQESIAKAAVRFNVNPKTIIKWRKRENRNDRPMGPKKIKSTVLSEHHSLFEPIKPASMFEASWMLCFTETSSPSPAWKKEI